MSIVECPVHRCGKRILRAALTAHLRLAHRYRDRQIARAWQRVQAWEGYQVQR